mmetsp:Transcript_5322/g.14296  ORF Transcript_5322/g.14296 Transcript_5322/m.14296 type:complete len:278 (+) Transcript_5322:59-892(+)
MNKRREAQACAVTNEAPVQQEDREKQESAQYPAATCAGKHVEGKEHKQILVMDTERVKHLIGKEGQHIRLISKFSNSKVEVLQTSQPRTVSELSIQSPTPRDLALAVRLCCSAMYKGFLHLNATFLKGLDLPAVQSRWNVGLKVAGPIDPEFPHARLLVVIYIPGSGGLLSTEEASKVEVASNFLRGLQKQSSKHPKRDVSPARPKEKKQAPAHKAPRPQPLGAPLRKQVPFRHDRDWLRDQKGAQAHLPAATCGDRSRAAVGKKPGRWYSELEEVL